MLFLWSTSAHVQTMHVEKKCASSWYQWSVPLLWRQPPEGLYLRKRSLIVCCLSWRAVDSDFQDFAPDLVKAITAVMSWCQTHCISPSWWRTPSTWVYAALTLCMVCVFMKCSVLLMPLLFLFCSFHTCGLVTWSINQCTHPLNVEGCGTREIV